MSEADRLLALIVAICGEHVRPMVAAKVAKLVRTCGP
jgi:hypothetical protein